MIMQRSGPGPGLVNLGPIIDSLVFNKLKIVEQLYNYFLYHLYNIYFLHATPVLSRDVYLHKIRLIHDNLYKKKKIYI